MSLSASVTAASSTSLPTSTFYPPTSAATASSSSSSSASSLAAPTSSMRSCQHCKEQKAELRYVIPTQDGKKEFCSEPCLTSYRKAQRTIPTMANTPPTATVAAAAQP